MEPRRWPTGWIILALLLAWGAVLPFDRQIAVFFHRTKIDQSIKGRWYAETLKAPGFFPYAALGVVLLGIDKLLNWREVGTTLLAMVLSGLNVIFKWIVGRSRPFKLPGPDPPYPYTLHPFWNGITGLFHEKDLSFPSGHACMVAAVAASLMVLRPRWTWILCVIALCTGVERFAENAHYASDVVAGYAVGAGAAWLARRLTVHKPIADHGSGLEVIQRG